MFFGCFVMRRAEYQVDDDMATTTVRCALALWRRDEDSNAVCERAAPNQGPSRGYKARQPVYKEGKKGSCE